MKFNDVLTEEKYLLHQDFILDPLKGSKLNLSGADLRAATLSVANLSGANLSGANLRAATLSGANLSGADLRDADLSVANLSGANLRDADLRAATLKGANLSGANLRAATLKGANLSGANLSGANLRDADLRAADLTFIKAGNNIDILTLQLPPYQVVVDRINKIMAIGCKQYEVAEWEDFDDYVIHQMDHEALIFWKQWRETVLLVAKF
jgi:Pentapeptide repeats (8 copies)